MSNEILPFGIGAGANVIPYADYEALSARTGGFVSGVARSEQLNTVWRQSSFVASVLAQFIANRSGQNVLDDGDTAKLLNNLELAIKTYANNNLPAASITTVGITKLSSETNSSSEALAATPKAVKAVSDAALKTTNNLSEIKAAGQSAVAQTLANLGIHDASTSQKGLVRLNGGVTDDDNTLAATSAAVKIAYDVAAGKWSAVDATTSRKGIVQLSAATDSTSSVLAATPSAVKQAYDLAGEKWTAVNASTSQKGIVQLNGGVTDNDNTKAATSAAVKIAYDAATAPALGKGQALQDLKASRGVGVSYTNATGFPIAVYVRITGSTSANLTAHVNNIEFGGGGSVATNTAVATAFFIVPNGASYRVDATGVSTVLQAWTEMR